MKRLGILLLLFAACGNSSTPAFDWFETDQEVSYLAVRNNTSHTIIAFVISDPNTGFGDGIYRLSINIPPGGEWTSPPMPDSLFARIGFAAKTGFLSDTDAKSYLIIGMPVTTYLTLERGDFLGWPWDWDSMFTPAWRDLFTEKEMDAILEWAFG